MKFTNTILGDMSGRLGGLVASRNRYGGYLRNGVIPVNPNSTRQMDIRGVFQYITQRWSATLIQENRDKWNQYAAAVPIMGSNGKSETISGFSMYVRNACAIFHAAGNPCDVGPAILTLPEVDPTASVAISAATQLMTITFGGLPWTGETGAYMFVHMGVPHQSSRAYFGGPYRYAGKLDGVTGVPITSPKTIAVPFVVAVGQVVTVKARIARVDHRLSEFFYFSATVSA